MATSGSKSVTVTSWDTLKFSWWVNSQSTANNTSTIGWKLELIAGSSGRIDSSASKAWSVTVDGKKYSGTNTIGISNNATKTLASGTKTITHLSDGTQTFNYSFSQTFDITFSGSSIGTKSGSGTGTLPTIPRASTLAISGSMLGAAQTFNVTRHSSNFSHGITYKCGTASGTVCDRNTTSTSFKFTPPLSLASQNTTGTSVVITYTITTYDTSKGVSIGSKTLTVTNSIPSSVKPSCSISVSDATDFYTRFGAYIRGYSKLKVTVTPTLAYNSAISLYSTTANGTSYSTASFTTTVLKNSGTLTINATVKDKRGRSGEASASITVLAYSVPQISTLKVHRCDEDGTENIGGLFGRVTFGGSVASLNVGGAEKNSATFTLEYKKASDAEFTAVVLDADAISQGYYIFEADEASSYNVRLTVADQITETTSTTVLSTAGVLMHFGANGRSLSIGKIVEQNVDGIENDTDGNPLDFLDIGYRTRLQGGILPVVLEHGTNLNTVLIPNTYIGMEVGDYGYENCPVTSGTFSLEVLGGGEVGQIIQRLTYCSKTDMKTLERAYYQSKWGEWTKTNGFLGKILWDGTSLSTKGYNMNESHTVSLAEKISEQINGIVLVFCPYDTTNEVAFDGTFTFDFIPKRAIKTFSMFTHDIILISNMNGNLGTVGTKTLKIYDDRIVGDADNNKSGTAYSGITYQNNKFVLTRVWGV